MAKIPETSWNQEVISRLIKTEAKNYPKEVFVCEYEDVFGEKTKRYCCYYLSGSYPDDYEKIKNASDVVITVKDFYKDGFLITKDGCATWNPSIIKKIMMEESKKHSKLVYHNAKRKTYYVQPGIQEISEEEYETIRNEKDRITEVG